ncbi:hypothetical protein ASD8599_03199 [Ascidiaceihabitans donghaensis]|uniref:Uncharacterized protein n=1 Tax=Ascidiaceihabitans donghaensis TaxID=1510460 RepID=A0A2R8BH53_9RHOB|nr:hypothetical protein ASD8599_03199 [Ascidiaceihabitans donghaensis]
MTTYLTGMNRGIGAACVAAGILDVSTGLKLARTGKVFRF